MTLYLVAIGDYPQPVVYARFHSVREGGSPPEGRETMGKEENVKNNPKEEKRSKQGIISNLKVNNFGLPWV